MSKKKMRVFETFAGIGAQHSALQYLKENYGFDYEVVATSEWDIYANMAYNAMHIGTKRDNKTSMDVINKWLVTTTLSKNGKEPATIRSLMNLTDEVKRDAYTAYKAANNLGSVVEVSAKQLIDSVGEIDLLTYSFPCQDLSVAGSFHGFNQGMAKGDGTRSGLLWEIERIVKELKGMDKLPKFLMLENVKNMISQRHVADYNIWLKELQEMGYSTKTFVLNSHDYGLPQGRQRVYGLSILDYKGEVDKNGAILDLENPQPITKRKELKDIIRNNYKTKKYLEEAKTAQPNRTPSRERMFSQNKNLLDFNKHKYTRTITTKQDRHPNAGVIPLNKTPLGDDNREKMNGNWTKANYRFMTPRETYLGMGFTDKQFEEVKKLGLRKEKMYQQAGNSIAVDVLVALFNEIQKHW